MTAINRGAGRLTLTLDKPGTYTVQLIINDGKVDSAPATATITATATHPPVANAGPDQTLGAAHKQADHFQVVVQASSPAWLGAGQRSAPQEST